MDHKLLKHTNLYAVYGTLRAGFGNNRLLANEHCELLGTERSKPEWTMVSLGGFPGVIPGGKQEITIEVYSVNSETVEQRLDHLEGYPSFYGKTEIETQWGPANIYVLDESYLKRCPVVESGDWKEFRAERNKALI
jgi:gamma-glutamylcyclotransferase (GGCT)/AIG2-like uncharacterized protein YtfP